MDPSPLLKIFLYLLAGLPLRLQHALGTGVGYALAVIPNRRRSTTYTNIRLCFPQLSRAEQNRLAGRSLIECGKGLVETAGLWLWHKERVLDLVKDAQGKEKADAAFAGGRGIIFLAPHLGAWEMTGLYLSSVYPMTSLYRPPPLKGMDTLMRRARERTGAHLVPTDAGGIRALYAALKKNRCVGILPDQNPGAGSGVFAPFFGVPANTMVLASRLAIKSRAPVFIALAERLPRARGYRMHMLPVPDAVYDTDLAQSAGVINAMVEQAIRIRPEQYLWCYKRFRTRPPGEPKLYHR